MGQGAVEMTGWMSEWDRTGKQTDWDVNRQWERFVEKRATQGSLRGHAEDAGVGGLWRPTHSVCRQVAGGVRSQADRTPVASQGGDNGSSSPTSGPPRRADTQH